MTRRSAKDARRRRRNRPDPVLLDCGCLDTCDPAAHFPLPWPEPANALQEAANNAVLAYYRILDGRRLAA